jgi:hypothetical protein
VDLPVHHISLPARRPLAPLPFEKMPPRLFQQLRPRPAGLSRPRKPDQVIVDAAPVFGLLEGPKDFVTVRPESLAHKPFGDRSVQAILGDLPLSIPRRACGGAAFSDVVLWQASP